jgi:hypothetical protein
MGSLLHNHRGTAIAGRVAALCRAGHAEGRARLGIAGDIGGVHLRQTLAGSCEVEAVEVPKRVTTFEAKIGYKNDLEWFL